MKYTLNFFMMMVFSVAFAGSVEGDFNQSKAFIKSLGNQAYQAAKGLNQDDIPKDKNGKELSIYERAQNKKIDIIDLSKENLKGFPANNGIETGLYNNGDANRHKKDKQKTLNDSQKEINQSQVTENNASQYYDKGSVYCSNGKCTKKDESYNKNFEDAASRLAAVSSSADALNKTGDKTGRTKIFSGYAYQCKIRPVNFLDCCSDRGWGKKLNLAKCAKEDVQLGVAKKEYKVHYIGTYCAKRKKFPGGSVCKDRRRTYCVFPTKLARIIREQGVYTQNVIYKSYGSAKYPNCSGFRPVEIPYLNLSLVNFKDPIYPFNANNPFGHSGNTSAGISMDIRQTQFDKDGLEKKAKEHTKDSHANKGVV